MKVSFSRPVLIPFLAMICIASGAHAGNAFAVSGEQLDYPVPPGWKLVSMEGQPEGAFQAEYIPNEEEIRTWRKGYLLVKRMPYPPAEVMAEIKKEKARFNELALAQHLRDAAASCSGKHNAMAARLNTFNGIPFAVSGGFCDRYGTAAPYGEGAFVAFAEGKDYFFQIQYGWRPASEQEAAMNLPWRITSDQASLYLNSLKNMTLCGGVQQPVCKIDYRMKP